MTETEKRVITTLMGDGNLTTKDLAASISVDPRTIERGLKKLRENKLIERVGSDKSGEWRVGRHDYL